MFEREIKFIYDFNLNKVNKLGPYFTYEQLLLSDINPAILHYISAEIDYLIFEDRQKLLRNSVFDYSGEKINQLFIQMGDEVKRTKRFSIEYVSKLILHASSFTINFLVRPKWTLVKFVFDEGEHKTTSEIKQILNYLYYYKHLKSILVSYINTKKIISMNSEEFTTLLDKVDNLGVETYLQSVLSGSLKSMAEFFNIGEVQKNKIPLIAVQTFLEEKHLQKHVDKIHSLFGEDLNAKYSLAEYQKVFDSIVPVKEEFVPEIGSGDLFEPVIVEQHDIEMQDEAEIEPQSDEKNIEEVDKIENLSDEENETKGEAEKESVSEEIQTEHKPVKIRIKVKENNEIEKIIEDLVDETHKEMAEEEKLLEEENDIFGSFEENIVEDIEDETPIPQIDDVQENVVIDNDEEVKNVEEEQVEENEFDKAAEQAESILSYDKSTYDEFLEDNEVKDIYESADKTLKEIEDKLNVDDEEESESMLKNILYNNKEDDEISGKKNSNRNTKQSANDSRKMNLTELLEHKEMTKIIEVVFDYDIEEFSGTLEDIMDCDTLDDALAMITKTLKQHGISRKSKEAELFKQIISGFFNRK